MFYYGADDTPFILPSHETLDGARGCVRSGVRYKTMETWHFLQPLLPHSTMKWTPLAPLLWISVASAAAIPKPESVDLAAFPVPDLTALATTDTENELSGRTHTGFILWGAYLRNGGFVYSLPCRNGEKLLSLLT
jgi:hypothetical protein